MSFIFSQFGEALGSEKAKTLPAFHAFTGTDNTYWKIYKDWQTNMVQGVPGGWKNHQGPGHALGRHTCDRGVSAITPGKLCVLCILPKRHWNLGHPCSVLAMILQIYGRKWERLPPTTGTLKQHIFRAHVQARVQGQAPIPQQVELDPLQNDYHKDDDGQLKPTTTDVPSAPQAITEMVRCQCNGNYLAPVLLQIAQPALHRSLCL